MNCHYLQISLFGYFVDMKLSKYLQALKHHVLELEEKVEKLKQELV